jgi:hypothetical protein
LGFNADFEIEAFWVFLEEKVGILRYEVRDLL